MNNNFFPILATFIIYVFIILLIAYIATRSTRRLKDYVLGGRSLSGPITALGAGASDMSSWLLMALPGGVYLSGLNMMWMPLALVIGQYCNWRFVAKRLRVHSEVAGDALTLPAYFSNRFFAKDKKIRVATSLACITFFTIYSAAGFYSGGVVLQLTFGIDYQTALMIASAAIISYTAIGGFLAVNWVDFFQGMLMFVALMVVPFVTSFNLGGWSDTFATLSQYSTHHLALLKNVTPLGIISLAAWGMGYFGQIHILVRFMAVRHVRELPIARRICMAWMIASLIGAILVGLVGYVYFIDAPLENPETVFIALSQALFNPWILGILLAAVLSAIMSTVAAMVLISSSILTEDFYCEIRKNASEREYIWVNRLLLVLISLLAVWFAADPQATILRLVGIAWSGLGASFGPTLLMSLFWRRMTRQGAVWGISVGFLSVILWTVLSNTVGGIFAHPDMLPGFEILPGFILSSFAIVIVSLRTRPEPEILAQYDKADAMLKQA